MALSLFAIFKRELLHYHAELMPMAHRRHTSPPAVCGLSGGATTGWRGRPARALFGPRAEPWEVFSPQLKRANRDYPPLRDGADAGLRQEPAGSRRRVFLLGWSILIIFGDELSRTTRERSNQPRL